MIAFNFFDNICKRHTSNFKFIALRARSHEANNTGYRFLREPARGRKFRRKDAVGDEKPTGWRNLARRQPPRRAPTTVLKFPRPHPTTLLPTPSDHLVCSRLLSCKPLPLFSSPLVQSGVDAAQLRLKTYDAVIFIAFRRLYAPLNFNTRSPIVPRANHSAEFLTFRGNANKSTRPFPPSLIRPNGMWIRRKCDVVFQK